MWVVDGVIWHSNRCRIWGPHVPILQMTVKHISKLRPADSPSLPLIVRLQSLPVSFAGFWYRMLSNSLPRSVSSCLIRSLIAASVRRGESPGWHHGGVRVSFSRLHLESTDTCNLRVLRGVVKTERVVDGGDVLNFSRGTRRCLPHMSIDRSSAAWDRTCRVCTPSPSSGENCWTKDPLWQRTRDRDRNNSRDNCGHTCERVVHRRKSNRERSSS